MYQLFATFGINWQLLLIQAVNFGVLLTALTYFLYRPIMKIIDERRDKIAEGIRAGEAAALQLADAKVESGKIVGTGAKQAEELVIQARARAAQKESELLSVAEAKADAVIQEDRKSVV